MEIEEQVISLDIAKKLKEVYPEQKSYFTWEERENGENELYHSKPTSCAHKYYSAFTASELMKIIPRGIDIKKNEPYNNFRFYLRKAIIVSDKFNIEDVYSINYECDTFSFNEDGA